MIQTLTVLIYPLILIGIGIWRTKRVQTHADFMVAGRSVPAWMLAGTLICTWVGSGTLFGGAGLAFRSGLSAMWFSVGAWVGLVAVYMMASRVRALAQYTVPDILEKRYNPASRFLGTVAILIAYTAIAAYQFRGGGWILSIVTDGVISPTTGMLITAGVIVVFTAVSGMFSIVSVDVINGVIITLSILIALPILVFSNGGPSAIAEGLDPELLTISGGHNVLWVIGVALPTFLFLFGESGMYQKFFSAKNARAARRSVFGMLAGIMVIETCIALLGITGRSIVPQLATETSVVGRAASETVILYLARHSLPDVLGAALLAAAVAIVLSTGSTMLLVASSNVTRDLYERFLRPKASDKDKLRVQRMAVVGLAIIGVLLLTRFESVLTMALYAYSVIGAALTPVLVAAFMWKRVTAQGATACLAGGLGTILGLVILSNLGLDLSFVMGDTVFDFASSDYVVIPGVMVSLFLLITVSLLTPRSDDAVIAPFLPSAHSSNPDD
ncbi:MAG: sodium:solute symporter family protein [Bacteroidetes bacterium]|nr:sodium:solute symporter family protein [Bacteroidota bacterium]